jgi:hypothetical protein
MDPDGYQKIEEYIAKVGKTAVQLYLCTGTRVVDPD